MEEEVRVLALNQVLFVFVLWVEGIMYVYPPIPAIPRVLRKLRQVMVVMVLRAPAWPRQFSCADLLRLPIPPLVTLPQIPGIISQNNRNILHLTPNPTASHSRDTGWLTKVERGCFVDVLNILTQSRKDSTD